jgi:hypothetical protein
MKKYQKLIVAAVVIGLVVGTMFYNKGRSNARVKSQAYELIQKLPSYEAEKVYLDGVFATCHQAAFDASYDSGKRHASARFDSKKYITQVFDGMSARARTDGKENLASELTAMKILLEVETDKEK